MSDSTGWPAPYASRPVDAVVELAGSKSLTNRYLVLAALADGRSVIGSPLRSRDTLLMARALGSLGAQIGPPAASQPEGTGEWVIDPAALHGPSEVDCGLAGTVMRFVPAVAALAEGQVRFDGDAQARVRPMSPVLDALRSLGVRVEDHGRKQLPFTVSGTGRVRGGEVVIDASGSSQFVSGLLLAGARYDRGVRVRHDGKPVPSLPHIQMTVQVLRAAGVVVDDSEPNIWHVRPGPIAPLAVTVEPDLSNAAAFLAAALVTGGSVRVPGWPAHTTQAGDAIREILAAMGARVESDDTGLTVTGEAPIRGVDLDLHDVGELTPVVAALAVLADSPSWIRGVAHLRGHETDRLLALTTELNALGGRVEQTADGLHIEPAALHGGRVRTYADHRMAMAASVLGLGVHGVLVEDVATTAKTLPEFTAMWTRMLGSRPALSTTRA